MTNGQAIENEHKVDIILEFLYKIPSSNENISYTLVPLIMNYGDSLDFGNYASDVFDTKTETWRHCDDDNIIEISDLPEGG